MGGGWGAHYRLDSPVEMSSCSFPNFSKNSSCHHGLEERFGHLRHAAEAGSSAWL